jgi:CubicO group peptidase (beta-lactamase class C family)
MLSTVVDSEGDSMGTKGEGRMMRANIMHQILFASLALLLCAGLSACGGSSSGSNPAAVPYSNTINQMTAYIENHMAQNNVTGLSIALVDGQNVVWARGFGYADKENNIPADADTIYEIASVSKTFAAATIMRLAEQGLIDIDKPITTYLPGFSINQRFPASGPITIRSILTHHSGIPSDLFNGAWTEGQAFDYDTWLLDYLKNEYTSVPVGSVFAYSNSAFALLHQGPLPPAASRPTRTASST